MARTNRSVSRTDRLNEEFKREISEIIARRLKNPAITEMVSVMRVETAGDLSHARVYVSVFSKDPEKKAATFAAVKSEAGRIRKELSAVMRIRTVPELHFFEDDSMEYSDRINKLLKGIENGNGGDNG